MGLICKHWGAQVATQGGRSICSGCPRRAQILAMRRQRVAVRSSVPARPAAVPLAQGPSEEERRAARAELAAAKRARNAAMRDALEAGATVDQIAAVVHLPADEVRAICAPRRAMPASV